MKNKVEYFFFLLFSYFFALVGETITRGAAAVFTPLVFYFIPIRKKVTIENLTFAYPDYPPEKIKRMAYECYKSFIITLFEILGMKYLAENDIRKKVYVENPELISENYCLGKGVILLSAHMGNWEYIAASVSLQVEIPFHVVVKSQRNPYVNHWMNTVRTKWSNKIIPLGISIRTVYQQLKQKNIVAMVADQRGPAEGIKMKFFGRNTSVYTGPAILALRTGAPLIFGIAVRQEDHTYKLVLHQISKENLPETEEEKIIEITRRQIAYLEEAIRKNPEQWLWMHKRWKH